MALRRDLDRLPNVNEERYGVLRIMQRDLHRLEKHLFQRYPHWEWGTFFQFGYRRTPWGLSLSFVDGLWPEPDELDRQVGLTRFQAPYIRRALHTSASSKLAVGVIHSHPCGAKTWPSQLDDDMDTYFAKEFQAFSRGAPYCSLILQKSEFGLTFTARIFERGEWFGANWLLSVGSNIARWQSEAIDEDADSIKQLDARSRVESVLGTGSLQRLNRSVVGIIGCSGTGSPAAHVLARAGVGGFVLVDPERFAPSNLERLHGSTWTDTERAEMRPKVSIVADLIHSVNPEARISAWKGNVLQENVIDDLLRCDMVLNCVDSQHGRAAVSDLAHQYLLPSVDVGVLMDGVNGRLSSQLIEINHWSPELGCAFCNGRIDANLLSSELMTDDERRQREQLADQALGQGQNPDAYWVRPRQLHTVGYLTTTAGALAAGYAEGMLTGTFELPHNCFQIDVGQPRFGVVAPPRNCDWRCSCSMRRGWGGESRGFRNVSLPTHWESRGIAIRCEVPVRVG